MYSIRNLKQSVENRTAARLYLNGTRCFPMSEKYSLASLEVLVPRPMVESYIDRFG